MNSMTGFGRSEKSDDHHHVTVELSSINRKQLDVQITLPRALSALDIGLKKIIAAKASRGRVQAVITVNRIGESHGLQVDLDRVEALDRIFQQLSDRVGYTVRPSASDFLSRPDIIVSDTGEFDLSAVQPLVESALHDAREALAQSRRAEGRALESDLLRRLSQLEQHLTQLASLAGGVCDSYREHLHARLAHIGLDIDLSDDRICREIALFAEKSDISEELTRLEAHFANFRNTAAAAEPCGRPLDFLCQEINREFNTIGSKAHNSDITALVVESKTQLEKIREQVQNVE